MTFTKERLTALSRSENVGAILGEEIAELARIALASLEAEAVADVVAWSSQNEERTCDVRLRRHDIKPGPLYTAPPATVSVPAALDNDIDSDDHPLLWSYKNGWNACRAAMLQGADGKPELTVWYGVMPETNGKTNWTAILHRKGQHPWEGITIECSEYPDRVRYEADRMLHLIGELADEPDILAYDADAHSGYVESVTTAYKLPFEQWLSQQTDAVDVDCGCVTIEAFNHWLSVAYAAGNSPVIQDGYVMVPEEPTHEMLEAGDEQFGTYDVYRRMIEAAPKLE